MDFCFSERVVGLKTSATAAVFEEVQKRRLLGEDVVDFTVGQPYFDFSYKAKKLAAEIIMGKGNNHYAPNSGLPELRKILLSLLDKNNNFEDGLKNVFISAGGAKQAIHLLLDVFVNPKEPVIVFKPYWVSYPQQVSLSGGCPLFFPYWNIFDADYFKAVIKESGSRLIILNNPVNPTGAVWSKSDLLALGEIAIDHNCVVICDEVYDRFVYGGAKFYSLADLFPDQKFRFIRVNSFSKTYAMMGYRIGYVLAQKEIVDKISSLQSQVSSAANTFGQKLAVKILENCQIEAAAMIEEFSRNRTIALSFFSKNKIEVVSFEGAFYCFFRPPKIFTENKMSFCQVALKAGVGLVDGEESGADGWVRICYAQPRDVLEAGLSRLNQLLSGSL